MNEFETTFRKLLRSSEDDLRHQRARLFARIPPPECLEPGHTYSVDLDRPWFESTINGRADAFGPTQLIGTFVEEAGEFLWGYENPSIAPNAWAELKPALMALPELEPALSLRAFTSDVNFAESMCQWVCSRTNWLGAYPAPVGPAIAFLALRLGCPESPEADWSKTFWCSLCGRARHEAKHLLLGRHGYLCDVCLGMNRDICEGNECAPDQTPDPSEAESISCLLCGEKEFKRIYGRYSAVCVACIAAAGAALDEQSGGSN